MNKNYIKYSVILILIFVGILNSMLFIVDETEYAIVTQFGELKREHINPGLKIKAPYPIQRIIRIEKRILTYGDKEVEFLTLDKKNILVDLFFAWKIINPSRFLQTFKDLDNAEVRLSDLIYSETGGALALHPLSSLVSVEKNAVKITNISQEVTKKTDRIAQTEFGISVLDVMIKRLNFPSQNLSSVFKRMNTEREQMASKYRAEGEEEALKIRAETDREQREMLSEAQLKAQQIKNEADAEALRIYGEAYNTNPSFYKLLRTLDAYKKLLNEKTTLIMSSESELFELLKNPYSSSQELLDNTGKKPLTSETEVTNIEH